MILIIRFWCIFISAYKKMSFAPPLFLIRAFPLDVRGKPACRAIHSGNSPVMCVLYRGGSSFFPRGGGGGVWPNDDVRAAASRFFLGLFWTPVSDVFLASTKGGGVKPYCRRLSLRQSAIGTYCVGLDILWWRFSMHIKFLIFTWQPKGGGGG